jgi:hypothetical protein
MIYIRVAIFNNSIKLKYINLIRLICKKIETELNSTILIYETNNKNDKHIHLKQPRK